uniref:Uncharacterized protein n=1 Tax=Pelusios castaneus TaxID=367368 RepID=A0A8C8S8Q6_9SAUR
MSNPSGIPEDVLKQRGRDGKMRREDVDDSQPEGKRLKLGNEGGNSGKEGATAEEIMPGLGREDPATQAGGEGKSVSEAVSLARSEKRGWALSVCALLLPVCSHFGECGLTAGSGEGTSRRMGQFN